MEGHMDEQAKIERIKGELEQADAVLIGAGAGLSTSAGFAYGGGALSRVCRGVRERAHPPAGAGRGRQYAGHHQISVLADGAQK